MSENKAIQLDIFNDISNQVGTKDKGNSNLVFHGIQNEGSDYRIHVCPLAQHVYVFPTNEGKRLVEVETQNKAKVKSAGQKGVNFVTGKGYAVAISRFGQIREILIPLNIISRFPISYTDSTSVKGAKAIEIVLRMLKAGLIPLPLDLKIIEDKDLQIKGGDITINSELVLQVKCDYRGGNKIHNPKVTGNLFLQIAECNPRGMY